MSNKIINNSLQIATLFSFVVFFTNSVTAQGLDFLGSAPLPPVSKKVEKTEVQKSGSSLFSSKKEVAASKASPSFSKKKPSSVKRTTSTKQRTFGTRTRVSPSEKILGVNPIDIFKSMAEFERENAKLGMELEKERLNAEIEKVSIARKKTIQKEKERQQAIVFERKLKEEKIIKELQLKEKALLHRIVMEEEQLKQAVLSQREIRKENFFQRKKEMEEIKLEQLKLEKEIKEEEWKRKEDTKAYGQIKELAEQLEAIKKASLGEGGDGSDSTSTLKDLLGGDDDGLSASELYMVTEVRGVGGKLIAKLTNKDGISFFAKKGTFLSSGHKVITIEKDHVLVAKDGKKEVLGFEGGNSTLPTAGKKEAAREDMEPQPYSFPPPPHM